jgi:hypothetical protein
MAAFLRSLRATDVVSPSVTITTSAPDLFPVGITSLVVRASDSAGNSTERTVKVTVLALGQAAPPPPDLDPPGDVTGLRADAGDHVVTLSWRLPAATDLAGVEVKMSTGGDIGAERVVSRGIRSSTTVRGLRNRTEYRFLVTTSDRSGNHSRGVVVLATPQARLLASPAAGTKVASPPLLRWVPVANASYYNVQLFRGKTKILSAWPSRARSHRARTRGTCGPDSAPARL